MKSILTLALLLPALAVSAQTLLTNDGTTLSVVAGTTIYVGGGVLNKTDSTLANAGTLQLTGDLTNQGTLTSAGTLLFGGTTNQTFAPGTASVATLVQNNTGLTGQNTLALPADLSIGTALTLTAGLVRTDPAATLTLTPAATLTGEASGRYVQGNLQTSRPVAGSGAVVFPNSISLDAQGQNLGTVTVTRTAGLQTANLSYGQNIGGTNKGIDRVWTVAATGTQPSAATPVSATVSWLPDDDNGFNPATNVQLWRSATAAGPWTRMGAPGSAATRTFAADVTQFGALTVSNVTAPLPVELTRFTAEVRGADALLRWSTASERDNDHFEVEASADGRAFRRIGTVAGHGTSLQAHDYTLTDPEIARYAADPVYYRLRQVNQDGTATYSVVRSVRVDATQGLAADAWPRPFGEAGCMLALRPAAPGPATIVITDALGRPVLSRALTLTGGPTALSLPELGALATGVYVLRVQQGAAQAVVKLVRE